MKNTKFLRLIILGISWFLLLIGSFCLFSIIESQDYEYIGAPIVFSLISILYGLYAILYNKKWIDVTVKTVFITLLTFYIFVTVSFPVFVFESIYMSITPFEFILSMFLIVLMLVYLYWKQLKLFFKSITEFRKNHKKTYFVSMMILIVVVFSLYHLCKAYRFQYAIDIVARDWKIDPAELDHMNLYNFAFKKIALFAGIIFSSTFLVLKSLEKDK
ncbi:MAG: hypothetical protein PHR00_00960 [Patescibacteria group bacterium]|nr:hypothetical protein [Patescibacteria group bacterium]